MGKSVLRPWVMELPLMQQGVLVSAVRGCDGTAKAHPAKPINRWYRRCILINALDYGEYDNPCTPSEGTFSGVCVTSDVQQKVLRKLITWQEALRPLEDAFVNARDDLPAHYFFHMIHAFQILGYKYPKDDVREWWHDLYVRLVKSFHVFPETEEEMDVRLGDTVDGWMARMDSAGSLQRDAAHV